ncbi:hypothetical protein BGZ59_006483 [Podila verticillata]|nr:hypothetical protein BGZ59_006483 [Podila verticillata]
MGKASKPESSKNRPITTFFQSLTGSLKTKGNTNTIRSYFLSDSKPRPNSPLIRGPDSPPTIPGPASSPGPDASERGEDDTKAGLAKEASETNPFYHDFDIEDPNYHIEEYDQLDTGLESPKHTPTTTPSSQRIKDALSPFESNLDSIDRLGSFTFGSQVSGESLRRLTLSPRKNKPKKDDMRSLLSAPTKSFAERLAAQWLTDSVPNSNDTQEQTRAESGANSASDHVEYEAVIAGSDPESEADWNDEILETPNEVKTPSESSGSSKSLSPSLTSISSPTPRSQSPDSGFNDTLQKNDGLSSDDDFPSSKEDKTKKVPYELLDSDSDLEDLPFGMGESKNSTGSSTPLPALTPLSLDTELDLKLTDDEEDQGTRTTRRSTRTPRNTTKYTPKFPIKKVAPKKPLLFSLASLLKEKEQREKSGYDIHAAAKNMAELDNELDEMGDEDYLEDFTPRASAIPKGVLSEEQEGALAEIIEEDKTEIVEDIVEFFVHWPQRALLRKTGTLGVDHKDLIRAFKLYGAKDQYLSPEWQVTPVTQQTPSERIATSDTPKFPKYNLKTIINLVNMTATIDPLFYSAAEIRKIVVLLLRVTTDPIIGDIKSLLGAALVALLEAIPDDAWESERHILCQEINASLGTSLPFILLVLRRLPSLSERMVTIRRNLALIHLGFTPMHKDQVAPNLEEIHRALFLNEKFLANSKTDYKALGYRFQVLSYCLDDDHMISTYGPQALIPVVNKLKQMHGRIVDVRAAFMDRTQTKDTIQRLSTRLFYAGIHRQASRQTTLNFEVPGSSK